MPLVGQVYGTERATLIQGDCLEVMKSLPDESVDAVVTDPPFKLSQEYSTTADPDNVEAVSCIWIAAADMLRVIKLGGLCAMFYDSRILGLAVKSMRHAGWKYLRHMVLYRRWGQASLINGWMSTSDFILLYVRPGVRHRFYGTVSHDVYVKSKPETEGSGHPAQKPIDCLRHIVERITPPSGIVLDPFAGSCTTGVAAIQTGRCFIGIESNPAYCVIAKERIAKTELACVKQKET